MCKIQIENIKQEHYNQPSVFTSNACFFIKMVQTLLYLFCGRSKGFVSFQMMTVHATLGMGRTTEEQQLNQSAYYGIFLQ